MCSLDVAFVVATVRNRSQPFATVRNRPREDHMAVPMVSSAAVVIFGGFRRLVASFRVAGVALWTCPSSFFVAGAALDVSCCVFIANRIRRAASSGDKVQIPWQAWHSVRCAENGRKPRTKHRF